MKAIMTSGVVLCVIVLFGSGALAYDFTAQDKLYGLRGGGTTAIEQARNAYEGALVTAHDHDLVYAVEQLSRLDFYEGLATPEENTDSRKSIFLHCYQNLDRIAPAVVGETPQYYFWKATCLSLWSQSNGIIASLSHGRELERYIKRGIQLERRYAGGGFDRLLCVLLQKLPVFNPFGPSRDLDEAKEHCDAALASPAFPGSPHPETATGDYFFDVFGYTATLLDTIGQHDAALTMLNDALTRIDSGDVSPDRVPETKLDEITLTQLRATLRGN